MPPQPSPAIVVNRELALSEVLFDARPADQPLGQLAVHLIQGPKLSNSWGPLQEVQPECRYGRSAILNPRESAMRTSSATEVASIFSITLPR